MAKISERGVIISFSCLLFEIAFNNVLKAKYMAITQTITRVKIRLLKMVIIPARSNTETDPKAKIPIATKLIILILVGSFSYFPP